MQLVIDSPAFGIAAPLYELRQSFAFNHFKMAVLGDRHVPGEPQTTEVMAVFSEVGMEKCMDNRTWTGWFSDQPPKAGKKVVANLDRCFDLLRRLGYSEASSPGAPTPSFYANLTETGLVEQLLRPTTAKRPIKELLYRAFDYKPNSPLHLHLDAIECSALGYEGGDLTCEDVKAQAARRVLDLIYDRWRPGRGSVYKELPSSLRLKWDSAGDQGKETIRQSFAQLIPDRFEVRMSEAPSPDWSGVGANQDFAASDIHKALVLLAADVDFLVAERFDAWVLDLVSAGIAAYALAQTNPGAWEPFGLSPTCRYWNGIRALFFSAEQYLDVEEHLARPFSLAGGEFTDDVQRKLLAARASYWNWLEGLGLSAQKISDLAGFELLYPHVFVGTSARGGN